MSVKSIDFISKRKCNLKKYFVPMFKITVHRTNRTLHYSHNKLLKMLFGEGGGWKPTKLHSICGQFLRVLPVICYTWDN
jgi:hypothetical protein